MYVPWVLISIVVAVVILAIIFFLIQKRDGWKREVDYRSYFTMGIIWLPFGIIFYLFFRNIIGLWFLIMGLVYISIGIKNKDKWGKPQKVSPTYQKILIIAVIIGVLLLVLGILVYEIIA